MKNGNKGSRNSRKGSNNYGHGRHGSCKKKHIDNSSKSDCGFWCQHPHNSQISRRQAFDIDFKATLKDLKINTDKN